MENHSIKFYSHRVKTGIIGILCFVMIYILYTKLLADPFGLTSIAISACWAMLVILFILGVVFLLKTFDPRPIIEIMSEGLTIRTFLFFEDFVPWEEVVGANQENYTNRVVGMHGYARVTTTFLRIYRPKGRSLAINLSLLNKRGTEFHQALSKYLAA